MKVYLDNAASTKVNQEVLATFNKICDDLYANSSAKHSMGIDAQKLFEVALEQTAGLLGVKSEEIIYTSGATESINTALKGIAFYHQKRGKHIITTKYEHPAVNSTLEYLKSRFGFEVTYLSDVTKASVEEVLRDDTILVTMIHTQSELGCTFDYESIYEILSDHQALLHVDMCQSLGKLEIDLSKCDLASFSLHKLNGLKGSGILLKKASVKIDELIHGANQQVMRSGTVPLETVVSSAKALRIALENRRDNYRKVSEIWDYTVNALRSVDGVEINSAEDGNKYILNISVMNCNQSALNQLLSDEGIYVSSSTACKSRGDYSKVVYEYTNNMEKAKRSMRVSFSSTVSKSDIDYFVDVLKNSISKVKDNKCG